MTDLPLRSRTSLPHAVIGLALVAAAVLRSLDDPGPPRPPDRSAGPDTAPTPVERGRGRTADRPTAIPARGWKDILWRVWTETNQDRVLAVAAGVTFYVLLAMVPFVSVFVSIYGLFASPAGVEASLADMRGLLPESALSVLGEQMHRLASKSDEALGLGFVVGLAVALWSATAGMKAVIDALNVAYEEEEKRSFVVLTLVALVFTLGAMALLAAAAGVVVVLPIVLGLVGLDGAAEIALRLIRWPLLLVVVASAISVLYRYGPSRTTARWRWVTVGSAFASLGFLVVSVAFSWYASSFGAYDETYGSLGAVVAFMTWIWASTFVMLVGAEINAEIEHQTARDSTCGPEKPMGRRGATMADTLGRAAG